MHHPVVRRAIAVQRYTDRGELRDGTWEEYRDDALGRRIMTRMRRNGDSPFSNSPLLVLFAPMGVIMFD